MEAHQPVAAHTAGTNELTGNEIYKMGGLLRDNADSDSVHAYSQGLILKASHRPGFDETEKPKAKQSRAVQ